MQYRRGCYVLDDVPAVAKPDRVGRVVYGLAIPALIAALLAPLPADTLQPEPTSPPLYVLTATTALAGFVNDATFPARTAAECVELGEAMATAGVLVTVTSWACIRDDYFFYID